MLFHIYFLISQLIWLRFLSVNNDTQRWLRSVAEKKIKYSIAPELGSRVEKEIYLHPRHNIPVVWHPSNGSRGYARRQFRCLAHDRNINSCKDCGVSNLFCSHGAQGYRCTQCKTEGVGNPHRLCDHGFRKERCGSSNPGCDPKGYKELCKHSIRYANCIKCAPEQVLVSRVRTRIWQAIKNHKKEYRTLTLIDCTPAELKKHLESQFDSKMSWDNYGVHGWHVDHRKPCDAFDLSDPDEQIQCFHYTNLQPMWGPENCSKNNKFDPATFTHNWNGNQWVLNTKLPLVDEFKEFVKKSRKEEAEKNRNEKEAVIDQQLRELMGEEN